MPVRLSVRAIMVAILALGCLLGWVVNRANRQRDAVAALRKAGGQVIYDWMFKDGKLNPNGTPGGPKWLAQLLGPDYFHSVYHMNAWQQPDDADMDVITAFDRAEGLSLDPGRLTDAGLAKLDRMTSLKWLDTCGAGFRGRVLPLATLLRLKVLDEVHNGQITDASIEVISQTARQSSINLSGSMITNEGVRSLIARQPGLVILSLNDTPVGDVGLKHLEKHAGLKILYLAGTRATAEGLDAFRKARPDVKVYH
jgi:internalin A